MNSEENERLIISLQDHVNNITNLRYGNIFIAESLTQRTKRLASKFFPQRIHFLEEIEKIDFKNESNKVTWNDSYTKLLTVSQAMLDEVQFPFENISNTAHPVNDKQIIEKAKANKVYATYCLIFSSFILWSFNYILNWHWLTNHPKKISIYLSLEVAIIFISLLFFTNNKQIRFVEWFSIAIAIALAIISLLT
jgi:hypothetical protein